MSRQDADLTLLADDPVTAPHDKIGSIEVLGTITGGYPIFDKTGMLAGPT